MDTVDTVDTLDTLDTLDTVETPRWSDEDLRCPTAWWAPHLVPPAERNSVRIQKQNTVSKGDILHIDRGCRIIV